MYGASMNFETPTESSMLPFAACKSQIRRLMDDLADQFTRLTVGVVEFVVCCSLLAALLLSARLARAHTRTQPHGRSSRHAARGVERAHASRCAGARRR